MVSMQSGESLAQLTVDLEIDRGAAAQAYEGVEQGIGVLAARETDHDAIARGSDSTAPAPCSPA